MEYMTCRIGTHFSGDDGKYIPAEEKKCWPEKDPITVTKNALIDKGIITEKEFWKIEKEAENQAEETLQQALNLPDADAADLYTNVFA
jgi:TPP-dependent pyruvate/acetoin dehydrogenase alpha subunit